MPSKTTFYILKDETSPKRAALYTCRVIEKAYNNNRKIYIYTSDPDETISFDKQLWTFRDISFVPHEIYYDENNTNEDIQILIGHSTPPETHCDILVNITPEIAPFYKKFKQIIEVVPNDEKLKAVGRNRFQTYKNEWREMETFTV